MQNDIMSERLYINDATRRFIDIHREEDVDDVALRFSATADVDMPMALRQIEGWQTARRKLPSWASHGGIIYPPRRAMEQCSGEDAALWKANTAQRLLSTARRQRLIDLTGGAGVDFAFLSRLFDEAIYVEKDSCLCRLAEHNMAAMGISNARFVCSDAETYLQNADDGDVNFSRQADGPAGNHSPDAETQGTIPHCQTRQARNMSSLIFIDPSRRSRIGWRQTAIGDCSPNVLPMMKTLLGHAEIVMLKLSPMLDISKTVGDLNSSAGTDAVREVHVVAAGNECKELLVVLSERHSSALQVFCVNDGKAFSYAWDELSAASPQPGGITATVDKGMYLYEPFTALLKAGCFALLTKRFPVAQIDNNSHLFVSQTFVQGFPGRCFRISDVLTMNRRNVKTALTGISHANIAVRNFPLTAAQLARRLRIRDGGDTYIFATTSAGRHLLIVTQKADAAVSL